MNPTEYLTRDNPRLLQLESDYAALDLPFGHTQWKDHQNVGVDIANFRANGAYLGQGGLNREAQYRAMYDYVVSIDRYHFLDTLTEDNDFGTLTYEYDGKVVSRDLCDSIMEMSFIKEALGEFPRRWLDVGAGYGRLAHRMAVAAPDTVVWCTDAVPVSTFLCEFYLSYRQVSHGILPLPTILTLDPGQIDLACNIHSFSEMSASAISFWLDKLVLWNVPYFFLVPHDSRFVCVNEDGSIGDFRPLLDQHGYKLIYEKPKYPPGIDGLYPEVVRYMYKLEQ